MNRSLLASGSTALEHAAALACAEACELPLPLRDLWNPDLCPAHLLPYLAWALSVDRWDERWTEHAKRAVIKASFFVHQHKGTIGALRHAVEPLGYLIQVDEWWQHTPPGPRGTFSLHIGILDSGMSDAMHQELDRLIDDVKPLSRHLAGLAIHLSTDGACRVASAAYLGDILTVYPYTATELTVRSYTRVASATHFIDTLSIYP